MKTSTAGQLEHELEYEALKQELTGVKFQYLRLLDEFDQYKRESVKWSVEDFTDYEGYSISEERAQEALEAMIDNHDASLGINWDTVRVYLDIYGNDNEDDQIVE